jgi:hypothetical protein
MDGSLTFVAIEVEALRENWNPELLKDSWIYLE